MKAKTCAVCKKPVKRGTGTYYSGRLVHRGRCLRMMKLTWYKNFKKTGYFLYLGYTKKRKYPNSLKN